MSNSNLTDELAKAQQDPATEATQDDEIDTEALDDVAGGLMDKCGAMACGVF